MRTIWKFGLNLGRTELITLPINSKVVCGHEQNCNIWLWIEVNPEETEKEDRQFKIYATGAYIHNEKEIYVATVFTDNGYYVWHIYESLK